MRACSRCSAGCVSACALGLRQRQLRQLSEFASGVLVQPASSKRRAPAPRRACHLPLGAVVFIAAMSCSNRTWSQSTNSICSGAVGLDDRAAALLEPAAHPDAAAFEPL